MNVERAAFEGHACVVLRARGQALAITTDVGPRILGFSGNGANLLAVLPGDELRHPGLAPFPFYGGHRLWVAPEVPARTYEPDDRPCEVAELDGGVRVIAPAGALGLTRSIAVTADGDAWHVTHVVTNVGGAPTEVAPWAITQVRLGGEAFLPLPPAGDPPQADRALVLWPYTDLADPRVRCSAEGVTVAAVAGPPLKVGAAPGAGWLTYRIDGEEFRIVARPPDSGATVPDRGAATQVFTCERFLELETLGALVRLAPGASAEHVETWSLRAA